MYGSEQKKSIYVRVKLYLIHALLTICPLRNIKEFGAFIKVNVGNSHRQPITPKAITCLRCAYVFLRETFSRKLSSVSAWISISLCLTRLHKHLNKIQSQFIYFFSRLCQVPAKKQWLVFVAVTTYVKQWLVFVAVTTYVSFEPPRATHR